MIELHLLDYLVIAFYFLFVFWVAWFVTIRSKKRKNSDDYFLAGRNLGWVVIGASLFASNIGSEHLIGLAGAGAAGGVAVAQFEILAGFILLLLGWVFVPFYLKSGVATMPEFLEARYSKSARTYLSFISILGYVLTKISVTIYAGAVVFEAIGFDFWLGAFFVVIATGAYTVLGGLKAVIYTDFIQMIIMIAGAILVSILGIQALGGISELKQAVEPEYFSLWKASNHPAFPWTGILFGAPILGVWYWCTDQFIVQRVLSAKNITQARRGTIFGAFLKMLPLFIFVIPGIICFALAQKNILQLTNTDNALPTLVATIMPTGLKGLVIAGLLAALMSSLSSVFNSCSTLITYDFYKQYYPKSSEKKLIWVGQVSTVILVILGIAWIPLMKLVSNGGLFQYLQSVQAYISPPIAAVFLLGLFSRKINAKGAMASLYAGFVIGIGRLILEINKDSLSGFWLEFTQINFLHFALLLFVICSTILISVSLISKPETIQKTKDLTFNWKKKLRFNPEEKRDLGLSALVIVIILTMWIVFS